MNRQKIAWFIILLGIVLLLYGVIIYTPKQTAGVVVPQGAAMQQQAWTTFEAYDNWTGGNLKTTNGLTNITLTTSSNSSLYIAPANHRIVGKPSVYLLRYIRFGNVSNTSAALNITLAYSYSSDGGNFTNITSTSFAAGNADKAIDMTLTAGKAPLAFTGNSMVRLDMQVSANTTVYAEIFGSQ